MFSTETASSNSNPGQAEIRSIPLSLRLFGRIPRSSFFAVSGSSREATQDYARRFKIEYNLRFLWNLIFHNYKIGRSSMAALRARRKHLQKPQPVRENPP
jgi:hypothetical protein